MPALFRRLHGALAVLVLALCVVAPASAAINEADLLPVDRAYVLSAEATAADTVQLHWKIAPGYYLYRHRMSVQVATPGARSDALQLPAGEPHEDEFFGKTETYRGQTTATLSGIAGANGSIALKVKYQGCADAGLCYPPQTRLLTVTLPAARGADAPADDGGLPFGRTGGSLLGGLDGGDRNAPLPEDQAFGFDAIVSDGNTLLLRFTPAPGYYLYRDRTSFRLDAKGIAPGTPQWPAGTAHRDEHFGNVVVYFRQIDVPLPLVRTQTQAQTVVLRATFQGCQTDGICYPPMTRSVQLALPAGKVGTVQAAPQPATDATPAASASPAVSTLPSTDIATPTADTATARGTATATPATAVAVAPDRRGEMAPPAEQPSLSFLTALLLAIGGGVILNLMPCVLPVLSLKVLALLEHADTPSRMRRHAVWYTVGALAGFVALGGLALVLRASGEALGWGFQLQRPDVVAVLGLVMFAFALSLSGVWHVGGRWMGVGHGLASRQDAVGDVFTGALAVVVAAPCTAPLMGAALGWAFTAPAMAALLVFAGLGFGLALPFLLIGFVPALARLLPRPGAWMETLKQLLAFPLYATAIWLLWVLTKQRGADAAGEWLLAALAVAFAAWAWTQSRMRGARWGAIAAILALLAVPWAVWTIAHLPATARASNASAAHVAAEPYSEARLAALRAEGRVVFVNMTADWCVTCKVNEKAVFARDGFRDALAAANAAYLVGDWTDVDPAITRFLQQHNAYGVPLYVVYPRGGGEGEVLPTVLTPGLAEGALTRAAQAR